MAEPLPIDIMVRLPAQQSLPEAIAAPAAEEPAPPYRSSAVAWAETLGLALLCPVVVATSGSRDLFALTASFPWIVLAPALAGLRYGAAHGLGCAAFLVAEIVLAGNLHLAEVKGFPAGLVLGLLVLGLVAGEFRDLWARRLDQLRFEAELRRARLEELARAHQILQASQARLEQRLSAGRTLSSLYRSVSNQLARAVRHGAPLLGWGTRILDLLATHCEVQAGSVHQVTAGGSLEPACAALGGREPPADDPVVAEALRQGKVIVASEVRNPSPVLAAVPFLDCNGRAWGVAAIAEMPFEGFDAENLRLLALVGGVIGDRIAACSTARKSGTAAAFLEHLRGRASRLRALGVRSTLVRLTAGGQESSALFALVEQQARTGDEVWMVDEGGARSALVLLALTDGEGAEKYLRRLEQAGLEALGMDLKALGASPVVEELGAEASDEEVMARVAHEMGLADAGRRGRGTPQRARELGGAGPW
jgi:hypothetical protein